MNYQQWQFTQEDAAGGHVVEVEELYAVDGEGEAEDVVGDPVLLEEVPHAERRREGEHDHVVGAELGVDHVLELQANGGLVRVSNIRDSVHAHYRFAYA